MKRRTVLTFGFAVALLAVALVPLTAGGQEGRDAGAQPGPAVAEPAPNAPEEAGLWDGDGPMPRDQVILDDLIVDGSACIGFDCVNGESFGFDTLRLKENNLRIKAQDTSSSASFPSNDWQITFNETSNGGANKFSIDDIDGGRTPFTIEASAPSHSLFVDDGGRIGFGTSTPVADLHVQSGNTPTLRLHQDGSSGFTQQIWDVAGNEANFFIRDATNGSTLPIRLRPGAPTSAVDIAGSGNVGLGTSSPQNALHLRRTDGTSRLLVEEVSGTTANRTLLDLTNNGGPRISFENSDTGSNWVVGPDQNDVFQITLTGSGGAEFRVDNRGTMRLRAQATAPSSPANGDLYYDSTAPGTLCLRTSGAWLNLSGQGSCS